MEIIWKKNHVLLRISDVFRTFVSMKDQAMDISKVLLKMAEEMRSMRETINQQRAEVAELNRTFESFNNQLRKRNEEIAKLKKRLSQFEH